MTTQQVGETAGLVWKFLNENGKSSISALEKGMDVAHDQVLLAIGWLAREGKVELEQEKRSMLVWLSENESRLE